MARSPSASQQSVTAIKDAGEDPKEWCSVPLSEWKLVAQLFMLDQNLVTSLRDQHPSHDKCRFANLGYAQKKLSALYFPFFKAAGLLKHSSQIGTRYACLAAI